MQNKTAPKKQAVSVMRRLARPITKKEMLSVAGASCAPSSFDYTQVPRDPYDQQN